MNERGIVGLIHTPTRLRIMATLAEIGADAQITFSRLQALLKLTPGNLSVHLRRLEDAGLVDITKEFTVRGVPQTHVSITAQGASSFDEYLQELNRMITPSIDTSAIDTK